MIRKSGTALILFGSLFLTACAGNPNSGQAAACRDGLSAAYKELSVAETEGFGGSVDYTKAAGLLTAAKVQYEFEKYPNCINKVQRARAYIRSSKGG